jgi:hypothetical protein
LPISRALDLGQKTLAEKGMANQAYIKSIELQQTAAFGGKQVWYVQWSEPIPASKPGKKEVGIEISMDGSVVHMIKGPGTPPAQKHGPR